MIIRWIKNLVKKVSFNMAVVYCTLIINGKKNFSDVPERLKQQVRELLIDLELEELIQE